MKVFIKTYGCQMNERDSEALAGMMVKAGHEITELESDADVMIFNTCSVRDQAERKAIGKLGILSRLKRERPWMMFGIMGCMAQSRGEELLKEIPHLDFVIGTDNIHLLPETLAEPYLTYNELQKAQGFDLTDCRGKQVSRYTYTVTNYPDRAEGVQANLYLCEDLPVAGDICCPGADGFQEALIRSASGEK